MTSSSDLLNQIRATLGRAVSPSHTSRSDVSDVFEAYIFALVVEAARVEGANVHFRNVDGSVTSTFLFRTSPGYLHSRRRNYSYAVIEFQNKPTLEAHLGVRVSGQSSVAHECDVSVLWATEAQMCRNDRVLPRAMSVEIAVECKFYTTSVSLGLARSFIGLAADLTANHCYFVVNTSSVNVEKLLARKGKHWNTMVIPANGHEVQRLRNTFQTAFANFKAKN